MKKVLIVINFDEGLYNFRKELLEALVQEGYQVHIGVPDGAYRERLEKIGCVFHDTALNRRGTNPFEELGLIRRYGRILDEVKPDVVMTYTIKPNVYMGALCGRKKIPYITTITGLGTAVEGKGLLQLITGCMYKFALRKARAVFFQNRANEEMFRKKRVAVGRHRMLPGSGVNLEHFCYQEFPVEKAPEFLFISRVLEEKGIEQYLDTAEAVKKKYPDAVFRVLGFLEDDYRGVERFERLQREGIISFMGNVEDVVSYIKDSQCTIHPSYYPEGMSNVCLESASCGRCVITTDRPGCRETIRDGETGFLVRERDSRDLIEKTEKFLRLSIEERRQMGIRARKYMEENFDREIVVRKYLEMIGEITQE